MAKVSPVDDVMAGHRPGHPRLAFRYDHKDVDARDKPGHDKTKKGPGKTGALDLLKTPSDKNQRE
jgi:hypothetical protein